MERRKCMEFIIGIFIGALLYWVFAERKKPSGSFIIDLTNPEDETFRLEWDDSINEIYSKKYITLTVKVYEDNSQK